MKQARESDRALVASIAASPSALPKMRKAVVAVLDELDAWRDGKNPIPRGKA